ncbi:MAG: hypothetical protein LRY71_10905 [Bacillaceae bacterium]|nr:hypothetical protein [Bacillaceae bacterium]
MNNFRYYIDREIETGDRGVGDKLEASQVMANIKFRMYDNETGNLALEGTGARSNFRVKRK